MVSVCPFCWRKDTRLRPNQHGLSQCTTWPCKSSTHLTSLWVGHNSHFWFEQFNCWIFLFGPFFLFHLKSVTAFYFLCSVTDIECGGGFYVRSLVDDLGKGEPHQFQVRTQYVILPIQYLWDFFFNTDLILLAILQSCRFSWFYSLHFHTGETVQWLWLWTECLQHI